MDMQKLQPNGFSLIEVLVAITLLLIALVGPMSFLSRTSQSTEVSNQRSVATFLAQEGVELVHKLRDDTILQTFPMEQNDRWNEFIAQLTANDCDNTNIGCAMWLNGAGQVQVSSCASTNDCQLSLNTDADRFWYNHQAGEATVFVRRITVNHVNSGRELSVRSEVTWRTGSFLQTHRVEVTSSVFNVYHENN